VSWPLILLSRRARRIASRISSDLRCSAHEILTRSYSSPWRHSVSRCSPPSPTSGHCLRIRWVNSDRKYRTWFETRCDGARMERQNGSSSPSSVLSSLVVHDRFTPVAAAVPLRMETAIWSKNVTTGSSLKNSPDRRAAGASGSLSPVDRLPSSEIPVIDFIVFADICFQC
jgi:hypothetical protein